MTEKHLFMFGGGAPFNESLAKKFGALASKGLSKVVILFIEQEGWQEYMTRYTDQIGLHSVEHFVYFALDTSPSNDFLEQLQSATGVIISGGDTELYRDYIVETKIGTIIKALYLEGVPVAGFSAGALISPNVCVIPPIDNRANEHLFLKGLGLINHCVISAHFSKWDEEKNLLAALSKTNSSMGYGIDDASGIYFKNERISDTAGQIYFYYGKE